MTTTTLSERADALELQQMQELNNQLVTKSLLYHLADGERTIGPGFGLGRQLLMGEDPRLPPMPEKPTLMDFFRLRFTPAHQHLLQSANLTQKNGLSDKIVLACLLHDIAVVGFIKSDHGYWGAQLIEPYVDEEVSWAIRMHQALRFFPDESVGYDYPDNYVAMFGEDYQPDPYIVADTNALEALSDLVRHTQHPPHVHVTLERGLDGTDLDALYRRVVDHGRRQATRQRV